MRKWLLSLFTVLSSLLFACSRATPISPGELLQLTPTLQPIFPTPTYPPTLQPILTNTPEETSPIQITKVPRGKLVVSTTDDGLFMVNPDGSDQKLLIPAPVGLGTLSPGLNKIAYEIRGEIHVLDIQTSEDLVIFSPGFYPHWSPDGSRIGFNCNMDFLAKICVINADRTDLRIFGENNENQRLNFDNWSQDGNIITFTSYSFPPSGGRGIGTIQILNLNTNEISSVLDETMLDKIQAIGNSSLSFDNSQIYFLGTQNEIFSVFSINLQTQDIQLIENENYDLSNPVWSPDGQFFFVHGETPLLFTSTGEFLYGLDIPGGLVTSWVIP